MEQGKKLVHNRGKKERRKSKIMVGKEKVTRHCSSQLELVSVFARRQQHSYI